MTDIDRIFQYFDFFSKNNFSEGDNIFEWACGGYIFEWVCRFNWRGALWKGRASAFWREGLYIRIYRVEGLHDCPPPLLWVYSLVCSSRKSRQAWGLWATFFIIGRAGKSDHQNPMQYLQERCLWRREFISAMNHEFCWMVFPSTLMKCTLS